jgi:hypothetical protein
VAFHFVTTLIGLRRVKQLTFNSNRFVCHNAQVTHSRLAILFFQAAQGIQCLARQQA